MAHFFALWRPPVAMEWRFPRRISRCGIEANTPQSWSGIAPKCGTAQKIAPPSCWLLGWVVRLQPNDGRWQGDQLSLCQKLPNLSDFTRLVGQTNKCNNFSFSHFKIKWERGNIVECSLARAGTATSGINTTRSYGSLAMRGVEAVFEVCGCSKNDSQAYTIQSSNKCPSTGTDRTTIWWLFLDCQY